MGHKNWHWWYYCQWASCQIRKIAGCACAGTFSPPPRDSDTDMHHGTCATHAKRVSRTCRDACRDRDFLWSRWRGNVPGIPGACATSNFTYLVRGPCTKLSVCDHILWLTDMTYVIIRYDVIKWKHFSRYRPFEKGIHRLPVDSPNRGHWRVALKLLWSTPKQTGKQTIETPGIWDAIALIMTSLQWMHNLRVVRTSVVFQNHSHKFNWPNPKGTRQLCRRDC